MRSIDVQHLSIAIILVAHFKIVRNTAKVFHHRLVAKVTDQVWWKKLMYNVQMMHIQLMISYKVNMHLNYA